MDERRDDSDANRCPGGTAPGRSRYSKLERLEALVAFSTERQPLVDWGVLERVDQLAWDEEGAAGA